MTPPHGDRLFEEETYASYDPNAFYPAQVGETLGGKYKLISKLGWGTGSTVWLAKQSPRLGTGPIAP